MPYNPIQAQAIEAALTAAGFSRTVVGGEVVYVRKNHNEGRLCVKVYTSLPADPAKPQKVRAKGSDAIRACLVFADLAKSYGLKSAPKVLRTGTEEAIVSRMMARAREIYGKANEMAKCPRCAFCGATTYPDSGRCIRAKEHAAQAHSTQFAKSPVPAERGMVKDSVQAGELENEIFHPAPNTKSKKPVPTPTAKEKNALEEQWATLQAEMANIAARLGK